VFEIKKGKGTLEPSAHIRGIRVKVGMGACGVAAGAIEVYRTLTTVVKEKIKDIKIEKTGCIGMCFQEPLLEIETPEKAILYGHVEPKEVYTLIEEYIKNGSINTDKLVAATDYQTEDDSFFKKQFRIVLSNCGRINPEDIEEYIQVGGYRAIEKALTSMEPSRIIDEVIRSGLRGRGGAGFPTGLKWKFARQSENNHKYVICNADEGDPGAFMDRSVLEGDPHSVLEGMIICACAIGASEGYIYVRAEYPLAVERLKLAIEQAKKHGFLGKNILGTNFSFHITLKEGAGAFVCGEETALMASIEGRRGMPRLRPPFPAQKGLWGKPTNINNVETLANIPRIIINGADWFASRGTHGSKGTKVFALAGKVKRGGLIEVPMGMKLREIIYEIGGGTVTGKPFKAVQLGGPSGGCIPAELLDTVIDYDSVTRTGAIMGSGGMVVMDEDTCMVEVARYFLDFTQKESCGKCTYCRIGTKRMLEILERITRGEGEEEDLDTLERLAYNIKMGSLCGLGQTAPNPVLTTLRYFRDEYEAHIKEKKCPAKVCRSLVVYQILEEKCTGCGVCLRNCPVNAISGERKKPHLINQDTCIKCGICFDSCKFDAIKVE